MEVLVHVFLFETSNYLPYYYINSSWWNSWNPWKESTFFFIENLLKFTYSNVEIQKIPGVKPRTLLQEGKG